MARQRSSGDQRSRAAVVTQAIKRERRRILAERDARILAGAGLDPELMRLASYAAGLPCDLRAATFDLD